MGVPEMATRTTRATDAARRPYRFTVEQLMRMIETGVIPDDEDVELIRGRLYRMTKNEPHNGCIVDIADALRLLVPVGFFVREEKSLHHDGQSQPEPDVAVVRGRSRIRRTQPPSTSEAALIVEVCHHTRRADYRDKLSIYASAGVPSYWVVDLDGRKVAVYTEPTSQGPGGAFARMETYAEDASIPVVLDGSEVGRISVKDILPL
jgi:Uma2 family endonuclease